MLILVVDDDTPICDLLTTILREEGYQVVTANDGQTALAVLAGLPEPPALIVLDLMLPWLSGVEVYTALRRQPRWATIPVIVWTAVAPGADALAALHDTPILHKPAPIELLLTIIEDLCGSPQ